MRLSKSKVLSYRQCPKKVWLQVHKPEEATISPEAERAFRNGNAIGEIARQIYDADGTGVVVDMHDQGLEAAAATTKALLEAEAPIFEAALVADRSLALADVMLPPIGEDGWHMVEVKSATSVKEYYLEDAAVQYWNAIEAGVDLKKISLAHVNNQWVYPGGDDYKGLLTPVDVTDKAHALAADVPKWVDEAHDVLACSEPPAIDIGPQCSKPHACEFFGFCSRTVAKAKHPVTWLPRIATKALKAYIQENNITDMAAVPDDLLNEKQRRVKHATVTGEVYFDQPGAQTELQELGFPAYFLDFESVQFAVPRWQGTRPYQQLVFQFSLHTVDESGALNHREFLDLSGDDPRRPLACALVEACGTCGPVFVYNANFEKSRISELAEEYPEYADSLHKIRERVVDLQPIAERYFYSPLQQGSWSLKKVLPAMVPELDYSDLEGVSEGGGAAEAYLESIDEATMNTRKHLLEEQLSRYCRLDTYATYVLWSRFVDAVVCADRPLR